MGRRPILVVDDDSASRTLLVRALEEAGLKAVAAASGAEALSMIEREEPSVVLLDLVMPPPDGFHVLRILRARDKTRDVPVLVLTAQGSEDEMQKAFDLGADDFVRKPFRPAEIVARIRSQLRLRTTVEALAREERDARVILELTQALASNLDFRGILFTVVRRIAEIVRVDRASIVLVRDETTVGYVVAASDDEQLRDLPISLERYPEIQKVLSTREPLVIADVHTHPLFDIVRQGGGAQPFSSLALLPILYEGRPMGVLFLRALQSFEFGAREIGLCSTVASATAIALRNARILQSLEEEKREVSEARVHAEQRVRAFQRYADFFESAADGILVFGKKSGHIMFSNPRASEITGYDESELEGGAVLRLFSPAEKSSARSLLAGFSEGVFPREVDVRAVTKGGTPMLLRASFGSVLGEEGLVLFSFRDVTAERKTETELVKTKDFLARVIDASYDAIVSVDVAFRVVLFNRAAERMFGRPSSDVLGAPLQMLFPEGGAEEVMRQVAKAEGQLEGVQVDIVDRDGAAVPASIAAGTLREGEHMVGTVLVLTDLRDKIRMQQRLEEANEQLVARERQAAVAELAGAAAHELNQPLTSVMGYAELLKRRLEQGTPQHSAASVIFSEAERMAEIVRKIGKITRYETKSYVGKARILDLDKASAERSEPPPPTEAVPRGVGNPPSQEHGR